MGKGLGWILALVGFGLGLFSPEIVGCYDCSLMWVIRGVAAVVLGFGLMKLSKRTI